MLPRRHRGRAEAGAAVCPAMMFTDFSLHVHDFFESPPYTRDGGAWSHGCPDPGGARYHRKDGEMMRPVFRRTLLVGALVALLLAGLAAAPVAAPALPRARRRRGCAISGLDRAARTPS